ncbi:MAG: signal recognition particle protein [Alphaproteobacteria bacterium RIFCSPHIGHO2_01_FULL_41_14]|nr:MAG: signal recognition particle protein [Alphaproteobacteria bacterium GWB1_45_5]OFW90304.1 MAG: signal recognition particle protein [Alphaproteobacteria bacterium RIFCSPHIGHO2_01_FULL_41_14]HCI48601.1 signal recognition particle protein [Holosporales bacterium]
MFENLSDKLIKIFGSLQKKGALREEDVGVALREMRIALLEADVALPVVKDFIQRIKEKAVGTEVLSSVTPGQMVVKIVHDELVSILGQGETGLNFAVKPPAVILLVGLQGSGKTTTTGKLAKYLKEKLKKKVLVASLDVYRPAAQHQLEVLATNLGIESLPINPKEAPEAITKRALSEAKLGGFDVVLLDTAGRLHVDAPLMKELKQLASISSPAEILLVVDAMMGQDAVRVAQSFQENLDLTGMILTRLDGDARGGAALSISHVTGKPIKFMGVGEKLDQLEVFHPDRIAGRLLGQGDVVSLVEKAMETIDKEESDRLNRRIEKGSFDLNDMATQLNQMVKMGGMGMLLKMLPGMGQLQGKVSQAGFDDRMIKRQIAIIRSMTPKERRYVQLINASRRRRIALGSGATVQDVNRLLKQFDGMSKMMKRMTKLNKKGLLKNGLKGLFG